MRKYQLSQHFFKSPKLALFLIGHSNIKKRDIVLDIGAKIGEDNYSFVVYPDYLKEKNLYTNAIL